MLKGTFRVLTAEWKPYPTLPEIRDDTISHCDQRTSETSWPLGCCSLFYVLSYYESLDIPSFIYCTWVSFHCNILDISAQNKATCDNAAMVPESICARTTRPPPPFAIHHMSHLVLSLILQWLRIIVPPVAGFNYSHDAKAQAVAAITSSITKNYGSTNLQMHCLPVALYAAAYVCVCKCLPRLINISEANCWCWSALFSDGFEINREEWSTILCLALHCFIDHFVFQRKRLGNYILCSFHGEHKKAASVAPHLPVNLFRSLSVSISLLLLPPSLPTNLSIHVLEFVHPQMLQTRTTGALHSSSNTVS